MYPLGLTITPEPRLAARCGSSSRRSPKKCRNRGSSRNGWRGVLISLLGKMFTTEGTAFLTALLHDAARARRLDDGVASVVNTFTSKGIKTPRSEEHTAAVPSL